MNIKTNTEQAKQMTNNARVIAFADKLKKQTSKRLSRNNRLLCGIWGEPKTVKF